MNDITVEKLKELGFVSFNSCYHLQLHGMMIECYFGCRSMRIYHMIKEDTCMKNVLPILCELLPFTIKSIYLLVKLANNYTVESEMIHYMKEYIKKLSDNLSDITQPFNSSDDKINPSYYKIKGIEVLDIINEVAGDGFMVGNILKYVIRHKEKGGVEDLKKARWYLDKLIEGYDVVDNKQINEQSSAFLIDDIESDINYKTSSLTIDATKYNIKILYIEDFNFKHNGEHRIYKYNNYDHKIHFNIHFTPCKNIQIPVIASDLVTHNDDNIYFKINNSSFHRIIYVIPLYNGLYYLYCSCDLGAGSSKITFTLHQKCKI